MDDDPAIAKGIARRLSGLGHEASFRVLVGEALVELTADPASFVAVITDLNLPVRDGAALAEAIHALDPELPVIVSTGFAATNLGGVPGVSAVLPKPYSLEELGAVLNRVRRRE